VKGYWAGTRTTLVGVAVTLPLLALHNVGILLAGNQDINAVDLLTRLVPQTLGWTALRYIDAGLLLATLVVVFWAFRKGGLRWVWWGGLVLEGILYGVAMALAVHYVLGKAHLMDLRQEAGQVAGQVADQVLSHARDGLETGAKVARDAARLPLAQVLIVAAGAGWWEEAVFRLGLVGGPLAIARRLAPPSGARRKAVLAATALLAIGASSLVFSAMHHLGAEEAPDSYLFWYRFGAGVVLSGIFLARGFAVAAWTHFLYDLMVMLLGR